MFAFVHNHTSEAELQRVRKNHAFVIGIVPQEVMLTDPVPSTALRKLFGFLPLSELSNLFLLSKRAFCIGHHAELCVNKDLAPDAVARLLQMFPHAILCSVHCAFTAESELALVSTEWRRLRSCQVHLRFAERSTYDAVTSGVLSMFSGGTVISSNIVSQALLSAAHCTVTVLEDMDIDHDPDNGRARHELVATVLAQMEPDRHCAAVHLAEATIVDQGDLGCIKKIFERGGSITELVIESDDVAAILSDVAEMLTLHDAESSRNYSLIVHFSVKDDDVPRIAEILRAYQRTLIPRTQCQIRGRLPIRMRRLFPTKTLS